MSGSIARICFFVLLLALTACNGPPWTLAESADAVTLRWYPDETSQATAEQIADAYSGAQRRSYAIAADQRDGSAEVARYRCR